MKKNIEARRGGEAMSGFMVSLLISFLVGLTAFFVFIALCSLLLVKQDLDFDKLPYMLMCACVVSALTSGFILSRKQRIKGILAGSVASIPLLLIELLILFTLSDGALDKKVYLIIPVMIISGAAGGVFAANFKGKRK